MRSKPSYLGLLNAIAVGELGGEAQFCAWAEITTDDDLRPVLRTVALREAEHARSFAKRLDELGYGVLDRPDPGLAARIAIAGSAELSDLDKLERLGFTSGGDERPDGFSRFFDDTTIDPDTGALMGRYVAEERDTGRRLRACHAELASRAPAGGVSASVPADPELCARIERLECTVTALVEALAADRASGVDDASDTSSPEQQPQRATSTKQQAKKSKQHKK